MSFTKAKAIAKTLRWHHIGFAFLWATTFSALLYPDSATPGEMLTFKTVNLSCTIAAVLIMVLIVRAKGKEQPDSRVAFVAGLLLACGAALFYAGFYGEGPRVPFVLASGALVGFASGTFYGLWQLFFTSEGATRTALYIPLSAVASAILCFAMQPLSLPGTVACAVIAFPLLAAVSLYRALAEIEAAPSDDRACMDMVLALKDLWKPVFCVCSIGFVWKLASNLLADPGSPTLIVVLGGFGAAALVIALIELFSEKGFEVLRSYQVLFPLITGAFLLPIVFGMEYAPMLSGMLMFGFEIVNLLLIVTCAVYANERAMPSIYVYALGLCPVYAAMLGGDAIGAHLGSAFAHDLSFVVSVLFMCVYVLSITMFLVSWTRQRKRGRDEDRDGETDSGGAKRDGEPAAPSPEVDFEEAWNASFCSRLDELGVVDPLSQREREVAALFVRGNSVAAIAKKLFISENTVRGHAKSIYRKLDVHSKQQLIDLMARK
ncbi:helix-turn-helix transcriptional regulator [Raoultibacter phocaeensis]|uniref:helix-turn-helix transcriptional regulator n=1 Tax=Raoultibacter phocaeensis TaxID=2479841 RepID=UPI0015D611D1|nr:LuxR C-terminal-related transcriptional regulator [Raoultibacter phocaeensis]